MPINDIAKTLGQIAKGSAMNNLADQAMAKANSQLQKGQGKGTKLPEKGGKHEADTEKALFLSVLTHAIHEAGAVPRFNLETQIRALNAKLSRIHQDKSGLGKLKDTVGSHDDLHDSIQDTIDKIMQANKQAKQHIG